MPKEKGAGKAWKAVDNLNKTLSDYIDKIREYHPKALQLMCEYIDDPKVMDQLRFGAAKKIDDTYNRLIKEYKKAKPKDFYTGEWTQKSKTQKKKEEANGILSLTFDEKDGTNG
jgi:hypothetical protein